LVCTIFNIPCISHEITAGSFGLLCDLVLGDFCQYVWRTTAHIFIEYFRRCFLHSIEKNVGDITA
jgi:hypothetical protein